MPSINYENRLKNPIQNIEDNDNLLDVNKKTILDFDKELELNDYSKARRYKYLIMLPKMIALLDKDLREAERGDIEDIVLWIKRRDDINKTTKTDYKILLKRFYRWVGDGEYPECISWLEYKSDYINGKLPKDMLVREDIEKLKEACKNSRDRALISVTWETGARIGELMDLKVGDLEDHDRVLKIIVDGKTGQRKLDLIESIPYLKIWLRDHPDGDSKEAPLWVNLSNGWGSEAGDKMKYRAIRKAFAEAGKRAELDKDTNPHAFRHSRATFLANIFTEAQLCEWFGWVQGSRTPAKYVHLSGREIDLKYKKLYGIEEEEEEESAFTLRKCPRCGESVPPEADYCYRCGLALSVEAVAKLEEEEEQLAEDFPKLADQDPSLLHEMGDLVEAMKFFKENRDLMKDMEKIKAEMEEG
ncbi:MAG: tyrosine-type recombinase/integrase [Thermoplasmata archaeon]